MISYRYHAMSIAAVFLALAVGIILGAGPLEHTIGSVANASNTAAQNARLQQTNDQLTQRVAADTTFATKVVPTLVAGSLAQQSAVIVALPGVPASTVAATTATLRAAGATVTGVVTVNSAALSSTKQAVLAGLAGRLAPAGVAINPQMATVDQVTTVLAATLGTQHQHSHTESAAQVQQGLTFLSALEQVGAISTSGHPEKAAMLGFVLVPKSSASATFAASLGRWLAADAKAAVVAGPTGSATSSAVATLRGPASPSQAVVTVDNLDTPQGQTALALGAARAMAGTSGAYGTGRGAIAPYPSR